MLPRAEKTFQPEKLKPDGWMYGMTAPTSKSHCPFSLIRRGTILANKLHTVSMTVYQINPLNPKYTEAETVKFNYTSEIFNIFHNKILTGASATPYHYCLIRYIIYT